MDRAVKLTLTFAAAVTCSGLACASTYECNAADKLSKLGASNRSSVSITSDPNKRECRFSVDGVPAGSPPEAEIQAALRRMQSGGFAGGKLSREDSRSLATLLVAASPVSATPDRLVAFVDKNSQTIAKCFSNHLEGFKSVTPEKLDSGDGLIGECGGTAAPRTITAQLIKAAVDADTGWVYVTDSQTKVTHAFFFRGRK